MGGIKSPHFHKPILYLSYMKLRPYQAPRRQPKINDMIYPPGSRQGGNVWIGGILMNVQKDATPVTPTPTPSITPTSTITPTPSITPTQTITPTNTVTPTQTPTPTQTVTPTSSLTPTPSITPTNTVTPSITPTNTTTPTPTPSSSPIPSGTTEANAYLTRVVSAGGTGITPTISAATVTLFTSLVSNNLYNKLYAFYPHLGGVSASHALNAKSTGNTITFNGGWTFSLLSGSKPNGTNGYGEVAGVAPNTIGTLNSAAIGALLSTVNSNPAGLVSDIGVMDTALSSRFYFAPYFTDGPPLQAPRVQINANTPVPAGTGQTNVVGTFMISRTGSTQFEYYSEGALNETFASTSTTLGTRRFVIGAEDEGGLIKFPSNRAHGFTFFGSGLSGAEASTLTTIIKTWANAISRTN